MTSTITLTTPTPFEKFVTDLKSSYTKYHGHEPDSITHSYSLDKDIGAVVCTVTARSIKKPELIKMTAVYSEREIWGSVANES